MHRITALTSILTVLVTLTGCTDDLSQDLTIEDVEAEPVVDLEGADILRVDTSSESAPCDSRGVYVELEAARGSYAMAVDAAGRVWSWGRNDFGQLGHGAASPPKNRPAQVPGLPAIDAVSGGRDHALALDRLGRIWSWGQNSGGQLGHGDLAPALAPRKIASIAGGMQALAAGFDFSLALDHGGQVWSWGANQHGQLGDGTTTPQLTPRKVDALQDVVAIDAGAYYGVALKTDGSVWAWGLNNHGQLGDGTTTSRSLPVKVPGLAGIVEISAGHAFALARSMSTVWGWGRNTQGQFGDGTFDSRLSPLALDTGLFHESVLSAGNAHAVIGGLDGFGPPPPGPQIVSAGRNDLGQLARNAPASAPVFDFVMEGWQFVLADELDAGTNMTLLSRLVWDPQLGGHRRIIQAAGSNQYGELGVGSFVSGPALRSVCLP